MDQKMRKKYIREEFFPLAKFQYIKWTHKTTHKTQRADCWKVLEHVNMLYVTEG